ncbi:MAG: nucleoside hydrolase [Planctomycetia bacterium]|nr:nucleoside hydrolase [Planctomycetia bacterium]
MAKKIILDVDPGVDDVLSLCLALFDPNLEILGITSCGGHVSASLALKMIQGILDYLDPPRLPRLGMGTDLLEKYLPQQRAFGTNTDLSDLGQNITGLCTVHPAEKIISDLVHSYPHEVTILTCGPLTNIARTFARESDLSTLVHRLIITGGTITEPGNASPMAEFNIYRDPVAARQVFRCRAAKTLVPLDVTNRVTFNYDLLAHLPPETTKIGEFLRRIIPQTLYSYRQHLGMERMYAQDTVSLLTLLCPDLFQCKMMYGEVECTGELTRGVTVFDRRHNVSVNTNLDVVTEVDASEAKLFIQERLQRCGHPSL